MGRRLVPLALAVLAGCASDGPNQRRNITLGPGDEAPSRFAGYRPGSHPVGEDGPDDGLHLEHEKGALDQRDVDRVLDRHVQQMVACYERAGEAQRYAQGDVVLKFFVSSAGEVSNVLVTDSSLGNFAVERCLVVEGRKLRFPSPNGARATDFEYSLQFRSSGEVGVVDWDVLAMARDVGQQAGQLSSCGSLGPHPVRAVAYVEPGGGIGSVGLSSEGPVDTVAAACVVEQIRARWRLPGQRGHVLRVKFPLDGSLAAAPPPRAQPARYVKRVTRRAR